MRLPFACLFLGALLLRSGASDEALTNVARQRGINFILENSPTKEKYLPETMPGGVAVFDYDNDGRLDLYFANGARITPPMAAGAQPVKSEPRFWNRLYHQNADGTFSDATERAGLAASGYSMGVAVADYDNDGYEDLFVTSLSGTILYRNNRNGTFTDVTAKAGVAAAGWSTGAGFFDFDNDGKLDLFVTRYLEWTFATNRWCADPATGRHYCHPKLYRGMTSILYRNNGDGTFTDVSRHAGLSTLLGRGLGVAFADYDGDGWTDVYVANDSMQSYLLHNNGNGTFSERGVAAGVGYTDDGNAFAGMGVDFADYDNDGRPDLVVTDLANERYMLFRNDGDGSFSNRTAASGLGPATQTFTGWGIKWVDLDNDGWKDVLAAQGHIDDEMFGASRILTYRQKPLLLRNQHGRLAAWPGNPGAVFNDASIGRGAAIGDLDNDGGIDVILSSLGERPYVLHNNDGPRHHWLGIRTEGTRSNRDGLGSRVRIVSASGATQYYTVQTAGSYLSASDRRILAGLGADDSAKLVEIRWPSGAVQTLDNVKSNQWLTVREPEK